MPSFWTIGPMNTLPLFPRINRRSHLTHLLTALAVAAATLLTVNAAFAERFLGRADEMLCSAEDDYRECIQAVKAGQMKTCRMAGSIDSLYPPAKK